MTQRKLAEEAGIAFRSIQDYESAKRNPKVEARKAIANALNVPYCNLFDIELIDEGDDMDDTDTKRILDLNDELIRINSELVEVNKGWQKLATEMLHMWAEERVERKVEKDE